jgi:hypothetical protein
MPSDATGLSELRDRHAEAALQLLTGLLNGSLDLAHKVAVAAALEAGGHPEMLTRFNPYEIELAIVLPTGSRLLLAKYTRATAEGPAAAVEGDRLSGEARPPLTGE